ncbi:1-hydroxycarotenoid 3,4-desaturase CrtD [Phaeovulum vinaykumarii]|uniref:1-hydroxycarotenoid 3,4-desaturase n=1 Tax=Phaeovulum vinaykumarii TaxID=407234 RepID=A0A1N7K3D5_9RHOB|nr:1-hydroxycarotenoid 3,4-desaturase CrtD [Phaeovulum vinaykumarii]SIS56046.1 1-hydroxycarotenoid 3,4-desaturase [Phaeovulum vinaykumarii]SOB92685.1 1-hydroxycarotenoid 3,4-desaturase [Phaeovulum vinaykumarii]
MRQRQSGAPAQRIVVIGAGMGGLSSALRLAHAGHHVTLLEARSTPGGRMRTLPSEAGPVDAGPTVLTLRDVFDGLFSLVGERLEDHLRLIPQKVLARHWWTDGSQLDLTGDVDESAAFIRDWGGAQAEADFRRFDRLSGELYTAFDVPMMRRGDPNSIEIARAAMERSAIWPMLLPGVTLARAADRIFRDPRLRQLFGRYATYVGGTPYGSPAVLALVWKAEARGVWAVEGGMHRLAQTLARLCEKKGAEIRYDTPARQIETRNGKVTGVVTDAGTLPADIVVFNGDPAALHTGLLGGDVRRAVTRGNVQPRSLSAWVWAYAAEPRGLPLVHHNLFFCADPKTEFLPIHRGLPPADPTLYLCAQDRRDTIPDGGAERFEIIMNGPPVPAGVTDPEPGEKERCLKETFDRMERFGLSFSPRPELRTLTTPAEFAGLFPASQGSLYGRSPHGLLASMARPRARSRVQGLYLAGGGAHPGAGVPMATLSGRHAAEAILNDLAST